MVQAQPKKKRSFVFWGMATIGGLFSLIVIAWLILQLDAPRRAITNTALNAIENSDLQITYGALSGNWPWRISITDIEIADETGVWLTLDHATLNWSPLAMMSNRVKASSLSIDGVHINRLPATNSSPDSDRHILPELPDLPVDLQAGDITISNLTIAEGVVGPAINAELDATLLWTDDRIDGQIELREPTESGLTTTLAMTLDRTRDHLKLTVSGREGNEGLLSQLAGSDIGGPFTFSFDGAGPFTNWTGKLQAASTGLGDLSGTLTVTNPAPLSLKAAVVFVPETNLPKTWKEVLGEKAVISIKARDATLDEMIVDELTAATATGTEIGANGTVNIAASSIAAQLNGTIADTNTFSELAGASLSGSLSVEAEVKGSLDDPTIEAKLNGNKIAVDTTAFGTVSGDVRWPGADAKQGAIEIVADSPLGPGAIAATVSRPPDRSIRLSDIDADWLTTKILGFATLHTDDSISGELSFDIASLEQISFLTQFAGFSDIGGAAQGFIVLPAPSQSGTTKFDVALSNFRFGNGTDMVAAKNIEASGTLASDEPGALTATVIGQEIILPGLYASTTVSMFSLNARGTQSEAVWDFAATGLNQTKDRLSASGTYGRDGQGFHNISIRILTGTLASEQIDLISTLSIVQNPTGWRVEPLSINYGKGQAEATAIVENGNLKADVSLTKLPLQFGGGEFQVINGTLTGQIALDTLEANKFGTASLQLESGTVSSEFGVTNLSAEWDGKRVIMSGDLAGTGRFDGSLALVHKDGQFGLPGNGDIGFSAQIEGDIGPLWRLAPYSEYDLKGQGTADFSASGTWSAPKITGTATLREGYFESFGDGVFLRDLAVDLQADNSEQAFMTLTATDGKKGRIKGTGEISFQSGQNLPLQITADFDKAEILRGENVDAQLSGRVTLAGKTDDLVLNGDIIVNRMDIRIPNELPASVIDLPAEYVNVPPALRNIAESNSRDAENPIVLAINVRAPNRVFVEGRGLNSEWKSKIHVTGDTNIPRIEGSAEIIKGTFEFAGRPFDLQRGLVTFDGGKEIDPRLDVLANRQDDDIAVGVRVKGPASDPDISFQSSPALPQEDVLARVLFGKPVAELSYVELAQLGESIATLSGKGLGGGGRGFFGSVRQSLGVDVLSVDTGSIAGATTDEEEAAGPSLTVGKYVTNRVYVGVTQGTDEDSTAVEVEVDITRRLSLSTEVGQKANSNIGLNWSWDY